MGVNLTSGKRFMAGSLRRFKTLMGRDGRRQTMVALHVYSVGQSTAINTINGLLRIFGTGAYHAAVEVYGAEWSYGYCPEGPGIFECQPGACEMHIYKEKVSLGTIPYSRDEVLNILEQMYD